MKPTSKPKKKTAKTKSLAKASGKVTITITNVDGGINVAADFDPPIDVEGDATAAQVAACAALDAIGELVGQGVN